MGLTPEQEAAVAAWTNARRMVGEVRDSLRRMETHVEKARASMYAAFPTGAGIDVAREVPWWTISSITVRPNGLAVEAQTWAAHIRTHLAELVELARVSGLAVHYVWNDNPGRVLFGDTADEAYRRWHTGER